MRKIKTSKHFINDLNGGKASVLELFIKDYDAAVRFYVDYLWNNRVEYQIKDKNVVFDIKNDKLDCPGFISTVDIDYKTNLSGRALKLASGQACAIISGACEKRKRKLYIRDKLQKENKRTRRLTKLIEKEKLVKPNPFIIYPELDSLCSKMETSNIKHFDGILTLSSLGKFYGKIIIPFKYNKHSRKLEKSGKLLSGIQINKNHIYLKWDIKIPDLKQEGIIVGCDTGINSVATLSDKQFTPSDKDGHSLNSILKKISRKKKGSKGFHKTLDHRDNFINWSINQLNFSNIKEVHLEKISDFRKGKNVGKFLNYFGETLIRSKLLDTLQQQGVLVKEEGSAYYSQRCSRCSFVYRGNRKGKLFSCKRCFFQTDADYNASLNHEKSLPSANFLRYRSDKPKKFLWKEEGFFNLDGSEIAVSDIKKTT